MGSRILVTGVAGFVGQHLAQRLLRDGAQVSGTYLRDAPELDGVELFEVDILDQEGLTRIFESARPDAVIHLAGLSHVGASWKDLSSYFQINVLGAENVLAAAGDRRVIVASSAEVYGVVPPHLQPIDESQPLAPASPYAMTKAAMERVARPRGAVVMRSFNVIGPGQAPDFALPTFAGQLAAMRHGVQEPVLRVGNLAAQRDFVSAEDAVEAYLLLLEHGEPGEVYNMGSGVALSIEELVHRLIVVSGVKARIEVDPERFRPADIPLLQADAGRLEALGWSPRSDVDSALKQLWNSVAETD